MRVRPPDGAMQSPSVPSPRTRPSPGRGEGTRGDHQETASSLEDRERSHVVGKGVEEGFQRRSSLILFGSSATTAVLSFVPTTWVLTSRLKRSGRGAAGCCFAPAFFA